MTGPGRALVEERNPSAATTRLRLIGVNVDEAVPPEFDAGRAFKVASESVWAWRSAEAIATAIASCPLRAGLDPAQPEKWNANAALARLLGPEPGGPNPSTSARQLLAWSVMQLLLAGRFGHEVEWSGSKPGAGRVSALWALPASWLAPVPTSGRAADYFKGFVYKKGTTEEVDLQPSQCWYHWRPAPHDWREPHSVLQAAGLDVSVAILLDRYSYSFLRNDARPAALMTTGTFPNDDERNAYRRQWRAEHQGVDNAGKLAFFEVDSPDGSVKDAVSIQSLGLSQKDAQMAEMYDAKIRGITAAFGVPLSVLGDASGRTYSNAAAEWTAFYRATVRPVMVELEEAINRNLAPLLGPEVAWFDVSGVPELQPAKPFDPAQAVELEAARLITPNEARAALNLGPIAGGDELRPMAAPVDPFAGMRSAPPVVQLHQRIEGRDPAPAPLVESTAEARAAEWRRLDAQAQTQERAWTRAFQRYFERQGKAVVARIEGRTVSARLKAAAEVREVRADLGAFDQDVWRQRAVDLATDLYEQVVGSSASRIAGQFGVSFDLEAPWVRRLIQDRANQLAGVVNDTTYNAVQQAMADGVAAGESIADIAARVREVFDQAAGQRAQVIARTEVISASNGSAVEAARQLPPDVVKGKEWLATADERTRDDHAEADGQVVPVDGAFDVGGESLDYPGDPAGDPATTISCRCAVAFVAAEAGQ